MRAMDKATILVVDTSPFFQKGLCSYLLESTAAKVIQLSAGSEDYGEAGVDASSLAVLGPNLSDGLALHICRMLRARFHLLKVVIISACASDHSFQVDAVRAGASACLPAHVEETDLIEALTSALSGHQLFSQSVLFEAFNPMHLTPREQTILSLLAKEYPEAEIVELLGLRPLTVRNHIQRILEKLEVHSRQDAVRRAHRLGWL